ncbi:MAG: outer membrane beta-barrel protein [Vicinamibacterales bacterium]
MTVARRMWRRLAVVSVAAVACVAPAVARPAFAQGVVAQGIVAATQSNSHTSPTVSGSVGYQFNQVFGLGVELTHMRSFDDTSNYPYYCCGTNKGHATLFTTNVRLDIPTLSRKVVPYVIGGGGVAALTQTYDVVYASPVADLAALTGTNVVSPTILPGPALTYTTTSMALTLGGGASIAMTRRLAIDADLRATRIMGNNTQTVGRFGVGVSVRF